MPLHHRDPFDRIIIAQATAEGLPIVGKDEKFEKYAVRLLW
jgi:PIN domain nuclease of toxin-antitoxin system